jgi:hypothetical protein
MTTYALLLERPPAVFQSVVSDNSLQRDITVSCAVVGEPSGYYGSSKSFSDEVSLRVALAEAHIADITVIRAIQAAMSGYNGFAFITYENAQSLGLLEAAPCA